MSLTGCDKVTDAGVSALGAGCGQLQSICVRGCNKVTGACMSAATWVLHVGYLPLVVQ